MFDFEKLDVYHQLRKLNMDVLRYLVRQSQMDPDIRDKWKTATINATVNLAEGVGRISDTEKKHYFTLSRGAVFESVSLMHLALDSGQLAQTDFDTFYNQYETVSKMLLGLYRSK